MRSKPPAPAPCPTYQAIAPDELLPIPVVKQRLRWGDKTVSQAQRDGLRVLRYAKWGYCLGSDLIAFLQRVGAPGNGAPVEVEEAPEVTLAEHLRSVVAEKRLAARGGPNP